MTQRGFVEVAGGRLHYEVAGDGPAVTLIHPGLWDMRTWDREVDLLAKAGLTIGDRILRLICPMRR